MRKTYQVSEGLEEEKKDEALRELQLGYLNLREGFFPQAEMSFQIVLVMDEHCADAWWGLMLCKLQISNEDKLYSNAVEFKTILSMKECENALKEATDTQKKIYDNILENIYRINEGDNY